MVHFIFLSFLFLFFTCGLVDTVIIQTSFLLFLGGGGESFKTGFLCAAQAIVELAL